MSLLRGLLKIFASLAATIVILGGVMYGWSHNHPATHNDVFTAALALTILLKEKN